MFGGFEIKLEGVVGSVLILFFTALMGVLFNNANTNHTPQDISTPLAPKAQPKIFAQPVESSNESDKEDYEYDYDEYSDYDNVEDLEDYYYGDVQTHYRNQRNHHIHHNRIHNLHYHFHRMIQLAAQQF
jgi:hypothetical protein